MQLIQSGAGGHSLCSLEDNYYVLGASIECFATPVQHRLPNESFSESEYPIVCHDVHKLV